MGDPVKWTPEALAALKARVLAEMRANVAEGIYPNLRMLEARIGEPQKMIGRAKRELVEAGAVDVECAIGGARRDRSREARAEIGARLLEVLRDRASRGNYPSVRILSGLLGVGEGTVRQLRDELRDAGLYRVPPGRGGSPSGATGLDGSTPESRAEIEARWLEIRAQKEARGESPSPPVEVQRSHDYRLRENRR